MCNLFQIIFVLSIGVQLEHHLPPTIDRNITIENVLLVFIIVKSKQVKFSCSVLVCLAFVHHLRSSKVLCKSSRVGGYYNAKHEQVFYLAEKTML